MQALPRHLYPQSKQPELKLKIWVNLPVEEILEANFSKIYLKVYIELAAVFIRELFQTLSQKLMDNILQQRNTIAGDQFLLIM